MPLNAGRPAGQFSRAHIDDDSCRVVKSALVRRGLQGSVAPGGLGGVLTWTVTSPSPLPSIDIIIPTRDRVDLMRQCIDAVEAKTTYPNYDIIILDNDSTSSQRRNTEWCRARVSLTTRGLSIEESSTLGPTMW